MEVESKRVWEDLQSPGRTLNAAAWNGRLLGTTTTAECPVIVYDDCISQQGKNNQNPGAAPLFCVLSIKHLDPPSWVVFCPPFYPHLRPFPIAATRARPLSRALQGIKHVNAIGLLGSLGLSLIMTSDLTVLSHFQRKTE